MLKPKTMLLLACILFCASAPVCFAEPLSVPAGTYTVKDGDTLYYIALEVFSDEERSRGAHWLSIYLHNIESGSMNPKKSPIILGPSGLTVHIEPGQQLGIPHPDGMFPSPESVTSRYGVFAPDGTLVEGFIPTPVLAAMELQEPLVTAVRAAPATEETTILQEIPPVTVPEDTKIEEVPQLEPIAASETSEAADEVLQAQPDAGETAEPTVEEAPGETAVPVAPAAEETTIMQETPQEPVDETTGIEEVPQLETMAANETSEATDEILQAQPDTDDTAVPPVYKALGETAVPVAPAAEETTIIQETQHEPVAASDTPAVAAEDPQPKITAGGIELFINPGASLYADATGVNFGIGVQASLGDLGVPVHLLQNITAGAALMFDGVFLPDFPVLLAAADLRLGYRIESSQLFPHLPRWLGFRLHPAVAGGFGYQMVTRNGREAFRGIAFHFAPVFGIDFPVAFDGRLRIGAEAGYHFYFSDLPLTNTHAGILFGWKL